MSLIQGQVLNNRYRIARLLGESSFGSFYRAWDINTNGPCILEAIYDTEAGRQIFAVQAPRLFGLEHPGLLKVQDAFSLPGEGLYLAMAFVEGESLQAVFDRTDGPLPSDQVITWAIQICETLAYLHDQQPTIIFAGLSPEGILITPTGTPLLMDFGAAVVFDLQSQSIAMPETAAAGFSPPDQYRKGRIDVRADVYALGAILYLLLSGKRLPESVLIKGKDVPQPRTLNELNPQISLQLSAVIDRAIQIDAAQRFTGIEELKQALLDAQRGETPVSSPISAAIVTSEAPVKGRSRRGCVIGAILLVLLLAVLGIVVGVTYPVWIEFLHTSTPTLTATHTPAPPTSTFTPAPPTATWTPTATHTPEVAEATATVSPLLIDDYGVPMALVDAGPFTMGSHQGKYDQTPVHVVYLDTYYIDQFEVTNARYQECVNAGVCAQPLDFSSATHRSYYGNLEFDNYPVIHVSWFMAQTYCEWRGGRLPTEAEWEKAARGSADEREFPWGDEEPDCTFGNFAGFSGCKADVTEIGSYEKGISPYMLYDLAGNVWEWVQDWYGEYYYRESPERNPTGPETGGHRVMRGGAFRYTVNAGRTSTRGFNSPKQGYDYTGLRCVKEP